ncbi:MAG: HIT domain-containing protein [Elusimicrobia bacterium]|nr:HIT domain-containing protein [Elusimicrobiota bacterium]
MSVKRFALIWAPWRMEYIKNVDEPGCVFCKKLRMKDGPENLVLYRGQKSFIMLNLYPYTNGHIMVAPLKHIKDLEKIDAATLAEMMKLSQKMITVLKKLMHPEGFNVGINIGKVAGAGILGHVHIHIVPRWNGDHNFMPVLSATKIMPQTLTEVYTLLKRELTK